MTKARLIWELEAQLLWQLVAAFFGQCHCRFQRVSDTMMCCFCGW